MKTEQVAMTIVALITAGVLWLSLRTPTPTVLQHETTFRRDTDRRITELERDLRDLRTRVAILENKLEHTAR